MYWLAHNTQLLRCAPHHVRPDFRHPEASNLGGVAEARKDVASFTDAKALYDSYHRESLISNVTDRRSSLEIRVVKEQIGSLGGTMRWVSSDRQLADGLTKARMRQTLADKLRHAKIKFLYDPGYVAPNKKTLEEKRKSWNLRQRLASRNFQRMPRSQRMTSNLRMPKPLRLT